MSKPKILVIDIETAPLKATLWNIWEQVVRPDQIEKDWHVMSWAAKWFQGADGTVYGPHNRMMYEDQRGAADVENDKRILKGARKLLDEADIVIAHNGDKFDIPRLNARFILNKLTPPASFQSVDTKKLAAKKFGFTSNSLDYLTSRLCTKYKKLKHKKFPGKELWDECLAGNPAAWAEMEKYNKHDVLSLEELYIVLAPWAPGINLDLYSDEGIPEKRCLCGGDRYEKRGFRYTSSGKYQSYRCLKCGSFFQSKANLFSKEKRAAIRKG